MWLSKGFAHEIHERETAAFEKYKVGAAVLIEEAKKEGVEAGKAAGNAILRAAELQRDAEKLREANLVLEAKIAPRRLDSAQQTVLESIFAKHPRQTIRIASYTSDVDAAMLGGQIVQCALNARVATDDRRMSEQSFGSLLVGISITGSDKALVNELLAVTASPPPPVTGIVVGAQPIAADASIFVGAKPLAK